MKTASVLFGLAMSAATTAQGHPVAHPATQQASSARHGIDAAVQALLRAPIALHAIQIAIKPLVDELTGDVMCGNVMGKGSAHHVCRNRTTGEIVSDTEIDR